MKKPNFLFFLILCAGLAALFMYKQHKESQGITQPMIGIYWGAFDPPTDAHLAIMRTSLETLPLTKLVIVVNNHSYKNYTYPLEARTQIIQHHIPAEYLDRIEILWQDDTKKLDYSALRAKFPKVAFCAIAGYDAYQKWIEYSPAHERAAYDAIAIIPRGDKDAVLHDDNAFLMPIDEIYRHVSSTQIREYQNLMEEIQTQHTP